MQPFDTDIGENTEHSSSFFYLSVPWFAARELWLSMQARNWTEVEATVQSSTGTKGGTRETIRVEVWYGYVFEGKHYAGHLIRDRVFGGVRRVLDNYPVGRRVMARVNPKNPEESYLPSGMSYFEPTVVGVVNIGVLVLLGSIIVSLVIASLSH